MRKVAIITGGARGIGRACALALARAGYDIALVDLLAPELERTATEIRGLGREAMTFEADVSLFGRAQEVAGAVRTQLGRIDFLLNNAGKPMPKGVLEISEREFDDTIAINLKSCFNYFRAVAPIMLEQGGGRIVSMSSVNAHSGGVTAAVSRFAYASAKAGILGMTRAPGKGARTDDPGQCDLSGLDPDRDSEEPGHRRARRRNSARRHRAAQSRADRRRRAARPVSRDVGTVFHHRSGFHRRRLPVQHLTDRSIGWTGKSRAAGMLSAVGSRDALPGDGAGADSAVAQSADPHRRPVRNRRRHRYHRCGSSHPG
jgi:NAD(P)-dependent dehydrogenase (short-subunit alcohol dehydrogenase family)